MQSPHSYCTVIYGPAQLNVRHQDPKAANICLRVKQLPKLTAKIEETTFVLRGKTDAA